MHELGPEEEEGGEETRFVKWKNAFVCDGFAFFFFPLSLLFFSSLPENSFRQRSLHRKELFSLYWVSERAVVAPLFQLSQHFGLFIAGARCRRGRGGKRRVSRLRLQPLRRRIRSASALPLVHPGLFCFSNATDKNPNPNVSPASDSHSPFVFFFPFHFFFFSLTFFPL